VGMKLKLGDRLVLRVNEQTTIVLRRTRSGPESPPHYELLTYAANIDRFERGYPTGKDGEFVPPVSTVRFETDSAARDLARAIGVR
jgi:hypothetical protein